MTWTIKIEDGGDHVKKKGARHRDDVQCVTDRAEEIKKEQLKGEMESICFPRHPPTLTPSPPRSNPNPPHSPQIFVGQSHTHEKLAYLTVLHP